MEEIVVTPQPSEKAKAPTAQIEAEEQQPEEPIFATASVEEPRSPTFQATSAVKHPEQITETTEEITVQTQVSTFSFEALQFTRSLVPLAGLRTRRKSDRSENNHRRRRTSSTDGRRD